MNFVHMRIPEHPVGDNGEGSRLGRGGGGTQDQGCTWCRAPMNTGADEMRGSSDCYHQIMPAQTRLRGNQVQ